MYMTESCLHSQNKIQQHFRTQQTSDNRSGKDAAETCKKKMAIKIKKLVKKKNKIKSIIY